MRFHNAAVFAVALLLIPAMEPPRAAQQISGADVDAVIAAMDATGDALRAGDNEAFLSMYTEDVFFMAPDTAPAVGKAAMAAAAGLEGPLDWAEDYEEVMVHGDWAHVVATWTIGDQVAGKAIYILMRQRDGSWKIARELWNMDAPSGDNQ